MKRLKEMQRCDDEIARLLDRPELEGLRPRPDLDEAGPDVAALRETVDELKESLDKANRRVHRLQGERTQLSALLEKRDRQIEALSRELGAHVRQEDSERNGAKLTSTMLRPATALVGAAGRLASWLGRSARSGRDAVTGQTPSTEMKDSADTRAAVIVLMLGLADDEIEGLLETVEKGCASQGTRPVCVIDSDSFELLRSRSMMFEFLPPAADRLRFDASLHWDLYIQRKLALIRRKWRPVRTVAFGTTAMEVLALWSSSPFEDTPLPATSGSVPLGAARRSAGWPGLSLAAGTQG